MKTHRNVVVCFTTAFVVFFCTATTYGPDTGVYDSALDVSYGDRERTVLDIVTNYVPQMKHAPRFKDCEGGVCWDVRQEVVDFSEEASADIGPGGEHEPGCQPVRSRNRQRSRTGGSAGFGYWGCSCAVRGHSHQEWSVDQCRRVARAQPRSSSSDAEAHRYRVYPGPDTHC